ncbi:hypothetical protein [Variovorax paradoxus]|uniref:Uncharacterized protein n=1 Tax=Variovorax paradoxus TaxID=34073 RepID=A0A0H2M149_VARPD|nr:hypothetical protein [Variovorax paradoxus]KLN56164.1 hypothetical protein VPARA_28470 [Variovorax paradoxus]
MFDRTVRRLSAAQSALMLRLSKRTQLIGSFATGAVVAGALLTFAMNSPAVSVTAPSKPARAAAAVPLIAAAQSRLDLLRNEAASGDEFSNRALSKALLDEFDLTGDSDDLYEAMLWVDRRWDLHGNQELAARIVDRYCGHRVVRWHLFCVLGE